MLVRRVGDGGGRSGGGSRLGWLGLVGVVWWWVLVRVVGDGGSGMVVGAG